MRGALGLLLGFLGIATGCVSSSATGTWISASQFNYKQYAHKRVAVMPVVLHELVDAERFPASLLQDAIAEQLDVLSIERPLRVDVAAARDMAFPYTPDRLRQFGRAHAYDAVVGATMVRFEVRPSTKEWSFTGNVTFVDVAKPDRRWTLAKTWNLTGEPWDSFAALKLSNALIADFLDVRRALRRGKTSVLLGRDTVVVDVGPALNLDVAFAEREEPSKGLFVQQAAPQLETSSGRVQVDVLAIDDAGIKSLEIHNPTMKFSMLVIGDQGATRPVYVAHRLSVPLGHGPNSLEAVAVNGLDQKVVRTLEISREAVPKGPVELIVIAASQNASVSEYRVLPQAARFIGELQAREGAMFDNGARAIALTGEDATRETVLRTIKGEWARPTMGKRRVLAYMGRAEVIGGRAYLLLYGAEPDYPEIGSMSVDEFESLLKFGVERAVLDVCSVHTDPIVLFGALKEFRDSIEMSPIGGCSTPVGERLVAVGEAELPDEGRQHDDQD